MKHEFDDLENEKFMDTIFFGMVVILFIGLYFTLKEIAK